MLKRLLPVGRKLHVGIVGGGVAGMRCAEILLQHGIQTTIIEARDRLGGRMGQGTLKGGHVVDLGPNWIHGTEDNPMFDLAKETGTVITGWGEKEIYFDSDQSIVSPEDTRLAGEFAWETIAEAFKESNAHFRSASEEDIPISKSLADFFEEKIARLYGTGTTPEDKAKANLLKKVSRFFGPFTGQHVENQSLKFFWLEECLDGETLFCANSYSRVLQRLSAPVIYGADIKYTRVVKSIRSRNDKLNGRFLPSVMHGAATNNSSPDDEAREQEADFDEVVMTAPLGWLKKHQEVFDPPLPARLSDAIHTLGYGTLDKVYITFSNAWWNDSSKLGVSKDPSEAQQTSPNVTATTAPPHQTLARDTTSDKMLAEDPNYAGFVTFLRPEYAKIANPQMQNQELCNLAALPGETAQPTLLFYIFGEFGVSVGDAVASVPARGPHDPATEEYISALWPFFEPYVSLLPNYDASTAACKPIDVLATAWVNDEFAGNGSYTNFPTGLERGDEDVMILREGLPDGGIWFAGEHTAPFVALGTVTGAYWSGEAVARRILGAYGLDDAEKPGGTNKSASYEEAQAI